MPAPPVRGRSRSLPLSAPLHPWFAPVQSAACRCAHERHSPHTRRACQDGRLSAHEVHQSRAGCCHKLHTSDGSSAEPPAQHSQVSGVSQGARHCTHAVHLTGRVRGAASPHGQLCMPCPGRRGTRFRPTRALDRYRSAQLFQGKSRDNVRYLGGDGC